MILLDTLIADPRLTAVCWKRRPWPLGRRCTEICALSGPRRRAYPAACSTDVPWRRVHCYAHAIASDVDVDISDGKSENARERRTHWVCTAHRCLRDQLSMRPEHICRGGPKRAACAAGKRRPRGRWGRGRGSAEGVGCSVHAGARRRGGAGSRTGWLRTKRRVFAGHTRPTRRGRGNAIRGRLASPLGAPEATFRRVASERCTLSCSDELQHNRAGRNFTIVMATWREHTCSWR